MGTSSPRLRAGLLVAILAAAALLRLWRLSAWPVFLDEDIYATALRDLLAVPLSDWARIPAEVGKPPLAFWLAALLYPLAGSEIGALRLVAALSGILGVALCAGLGRRLSGPGLGLMLAALQAFSPFAVLHERMGLLDALLSALVLASVVCTWDALGAGPGRSAVLAAVAGMGAVLTKQPGLVTLVVAPLLLWALAPRPVPWTLAGRALVCLAGPLAALVALRLSARHQNLVDQVGERFAPLAHAAGNLREMADSLVTYWPAGLPIALVFGALQLLRRRPRVLVVLVALALAWIAPFVAFSNLAAARYYLPAQPYLLAVAGLGIVELVRAARRWDRVAGTLALGCVLLAGFVYCGRSVGLVLDHSQARLSANDDWQYRSGWPSGYGYREARAFATAREAPRVPVRCFFKSPHFVAAGCSEQAGLGVAHSRASELWAEIAEERAEAVLVITDASGPALDEFVAELGEAARVETLIRFGRPDGSEGAAVLRISRAGSGAGGS